MPWRRRLERRAGCSARIRVNAKSLYREVLLDHYRYPRNQGDLDDAAVIRRGSNPRCGDEIEVGINLSGDLLEKVQFRGRGCSICIASASLMTEAVTGIERDQAHELSNRMTEWISGAEESDKPNLSEALQALAAIRENPARRRCVLLAWEALDKAMGFDRD